MKFALYILFVGLSFTTSAETIGQTDAPAAPKSAGTGEVSSEAIVSALSKNSLAKCGVEEAKRRVKGIRKCGAPTVQPNGKGQFKVYITCTNGATPKKGQDFDPSYETQLQLEVISSDGKNIEIKGLNFEDAG